MVRHCDAFRLQIDVIVLLRFKPVLRRLTVLNHRLYFGFVVDWDRVAKRLLSSNKEQ